MENGPFFKMYVLLKIGDIPASYLSLPEGNSKRPSINHLSGQIIATSHDLTPNGGLVREIPLFQGNLGW